MNQARERLCHTWQHIQSFLFPMIWNELGELTAKQKQLVSTLEIAKLEEHLPYAGKYPGRPLEGRIAIARAFVTKMVYNMTTHASCWIDWRATQRFDGFADGSVGKMSPVNRPSRVLFLSLLKAVYPNGCIRH